MAKFTIEFFSFYDSAGMERRMEQMAKKGWLPEKIGSFFWRWKSIDPQPLHFSVTYFPDASEFDPHPTEGQEIFADFCARSGWTLLLRWGQMQVFTSNQAAPLPIETDAPVQVETIHRTMRKSVLPTQLVMLALCLWQLVFSGIRWSYDPVEFLATPTSVYMVPAWLLMLLGCLWELLFYFRWYRRAKRLAREADTFLHIKTNHIVSAFFLLPSLLIFLVAAMGSTVTLGGTVLWLVLMGFIFLMANRAKKAMKRWNFSRRTNRTLTVLTVFLTTTGTMVLLCWAIIGFDGFDSKQPVGTYEHHGFKMNIYDDPLPITVEELTGADGIWSKEERSTESIFLARREYRQDALPTGDHDAQSLTYTVIDVKIPLLYDLCLAELLTEDEDWPEEYRDTYKAADAAPWLADAAYRKYSHDGIAYRRHILCYRHTIVIFSPDWDLTAQQMAAVGRALEQ